jgi:outer membrane lipoprotein-sorting protein
VKNKEDLMKKLLAVLFMFISINIYALETDIHTILVNIDTTRNFEDTDFSCVYTIVSEKEGEDMEVTQAKAFRRDTEDKMTIIVLQPEVERGQGYILLDDNLWFYDPESRQFAHTTPKDDFQDSHAKNSDFQKSSFAYDYDVESYEEGMLGKYPVYIITLAANNNEVSYPYLKIWVRKDNNLLLKNENYSLTRRLMRTIYYPNYIQIDERIIPSTILIIDELTEGDRTQVTVKDVSFTGLPDYVFTKAYIEQANH